MSLLYAHSVKAVSSGVSCCPCRAVLDPSFRALAESTVEGESWKEAPWGQDSSVGICAIMILCAIEMVVRYQKFFCFAVLLLSNVIVNCCSLLNLRLSNLTKL